MRDLFLKPIVTFNVCPVYLVESRAHLDAKVLNVPEHLLVKEMVELFELLFQCLDYDLCTATATTRAGRRLGRA